MSDIDRAAPVPSNRLALLWTRAVGAGGLPLAAIAMFTGPNMWNLGRIIAAGCALVCIPFTMALVAPLADRARRFRTSGLSGPRLTRVALAVLAAYLALAAVWFTVGLLGWLGIADPAPVQGVLRWAAVPLALGALIVTVPLSGEAAGLDIVRCLLLFADLLAQAVAAAAGILLAAAPFEYVGVEVRAYLVAVFLVAMVVHLAVMAAGWSGWRALADAGLSEARSTLPSWVGAGLAIGAIVLAHTVPGWVGPIAGGLIGEVALCLSCLRPPARNLSGYGMRGRTR